ncbi:MAG: DUF2147 domain-containing protein [Burkholderiaceae bacterium]|nr:DUF2147 domain-containing protein [Burkholderiaceae bacterium]
MKRLLLTLAAVIFSTVALAENTSPVGLWRTIDDSTGQAKALIRITESNGELTGKIEKTFTQPGKEPLIKCIKCDDARKDQPLVGLTILSGLKRDGEEYKGGEILDPENGNVYRSKLVVAGDGKKLTVRGYIGVPMLGRSQTWLREE